MADALDQFLEPSERVLYRTPQEWFPRGLRRELWLCAGFVAMALAVGYYSFDRVGFSRVINYAMIVAGLAYGRVSHTRSNLAAVTDRRVLRIDGNSEPSRFQSVDLEDVEAVEIFTHEVRVTKNNGTVVALAHPEYASEIGLALASAVGQPAPPVPSGQEFAANTAAALAGLAGWIYIVNLGWRLLSAADLVPTSYWQWLPLLAAGLLAAVPGWLAGEAIAAAILRCFLDPTTFDRWRRGYLRPPAAQATPGRLAWLQRWRRSLFDFVIGPVPGGEHQGPGHG